MLIALVAVLASQSEVVTVAKPSGEGWECVSQHGEDPKTGMTGEVTKCRRPQGEFFFLLAKSYAVRPEDAVPAERLVKELYPADYKKLFATVSSLTTKKEKLDGRDAWQLELDAEHASRGKIHKRERVATNGAQVMLVSAEGDPALFTKFGKEIDSWFKGAHFKSAK